MRRAYFYAAVGAVLAAGAPLGWLALRGLSWDHLRSEQSLYIYMWLGTTTAFVIFGAVIGNFTDRLSEMALVDKRTGLKNTRYFEERLREEIARSTREKAPLALIMGDLDHFKRVNDTHGHSVGDDVLAATGRAILETVRGGDSACRVGGEEFSVLCPGLARDEAVAIAERVREAVGRMDVNGVKITISLGVAIHPPCASGPDLVKAADEAMYRAKKNGRNRVEA